MKKLIAITVLAAAVAGVAGQAFAGTNPLINLALDVQAKAKTRSSGSCVGMPVYSSCSSIVQEAAATGEKDVIICLYNFVGLTAAEFAIDWTPDYSYVSFGSFTKCSTLDVTVIGPGRISTQLAWSSCQVPGSGGILVAGWFRAIGLAGGSRFEVGATDQGNLATRDCAFATDLFHTVHGGRIARPAGPADLAPCVQGPTAVENTTWSGVKALYR